MGRKISQFSRVRSLLNTDLVPIVRTVEQNLQDRNKTIAIEDLVISNNLDGNLICNSNCSIGAKCLQLYSEQLNTKVIIKVGFDIEIEEGINSIEVHTWSQEPNEDLIGRQWYANLPHTGGLFNLNINKDNRWLSIFARNLNNQSFYDAVCFTVTGNIITLISF